MIAKETENAATAEPKRCITGDEAGRRCWREATTSAWDEGPEPKRCEEHQKAFDLAQQLDGMIYALETVGGFLRSDAVDGDPSGYLAERARGWRDGVAEDAARTAHRLRVAEFLANQGPENKGPKNPLMREYGAHLLIRSDALTNAYVALLDERAPNSGTERLVILDALRQAREEAGDQYAAFGEEQGMGRS